VHDHLVQRFGELFLWYEEMRNTSGQYWVLHSTEYFGIKYDVCRFVSAGRLPFVTGVLSHVSIKHLLT